jgi:hypothetical protein
MKLTKNNILFSALLIVALVIGWFHLRMGLKAIFVFGNNEPFASWACIIGGPLSTLPATLTSIFSKKVGGYWLLVGGVISLTTYVFPAMDFRILSFLLRVILPMIVLGISFLALSSIRMKS